MENRRRQLEKFKWNFGTDRCVNFHGETTSGLDGYQSLLNCQETGDANDSSDTFTSSELDREHLRRYNQLLYVHYEIAQNIKTSSTLLLLFNRTFRRRMFQLKRKWDISTVHNNDFSHEIRNLENWEGLEEGFRRRVSKLGEDRTISVEHGCCFYIDCRSKFYCTL